MVKRVRWGRQFQRGNLHQYHDGYQHIHTDSLTDGIGDGYCYLVANADSRRIRRKRNPFPDADTTGSGITDSYSEPGNVAHDHTDTGTDGYPDPNTHSDSYTDPNAHGNDVDHRAS